MRASLFCIASQTKLSIGQYPAAFVPFLPPDSPGNPHLVIHGVFHGQDLFHGDRFEDRYLHFDFNPYDGIHKQNGKNYTGQTENLCPLNRVRLGSLWRNTSRSI